MFRITEDTSSGSLVQCLAKNYKNDSIVSVDMDKVGVMAAYMYCILYIIYIINRICRHNTDLVHVNGHDRIILVIFMCIYIYNMYILYIYIIFFILYIFYIYL